MDRSDITMADYGRRELLAILHRNYLVGLCLSIMIHGLVISSWYVVQHVLGEEDVIPSVRVRILKYSDLGPPPSIGAKPPAPAVSVAAFVKPNFGTPVPVPDLEVSPDESFTTQRELSTLPSPLTEDSGGNERAFQVIENRTPTVEEESAEPGINDVVPVDKLPEIVSVVVPKYPEMAIRAGIEGTVLMKLLVGKDGKVLKAVVVKSEAEVFNEATMEAARKFVFTPAYTQKGPVKVWFEIPFRFMLKDAPFAEGR